MAAMERNQDEIKRKQDEMKVKQVFQSFVILNYDKLNCCQNKHSRIYPFDSLECIVSSSQSKHKGKHTSRKI